MPDGILEKLFDGAAVLANRWRPLKRQRSPVWASVIGAALGGIGLAIYFRTFVDFFIPFVVLVAAFATVAAVGLEMPFGWLTSIVIWARYGYVRARKSNVLLEAAA